MTKLNCFSLSFSGVNGNDFLKELLRFLGGLKVDLNEIHICTEHSIMFFSAKKFDVLCELIEERFFNSALIQFSQIKSSPTKKFLIRCSALSKETIERFNELKGRI